ncbi:hypothetical protein L596_001018 [Steinernema carpocapsae]|uniref:Uncharacterized protein n=1 Tax=Steinernema carpocapsae TaxID=34508 RepID=A0A4U8UP17_STECR|nr:hypothetical protein L596_001018 [Steinernema carpocapsae]
MEGTDVRQSSKFIPGKLGSGIFDRNNKPSRSLRGDISLIGFLWARSSVTDEGDLDMRVFYIRDLGCSAEKRLSLMLERCELCLNCDVKQHDKVLFKYA